MHTSPDMPDLQPVVAALRLPGHHVEQALQHVPAVPGLYAIKGSSAAVQSLGLDPSASSMPIYVGKAERSLVSRDLRTHFMTGKTGQSTLRRSLAALLREELNLLAEPRNRLRPDNSANFSVEAGGDQRLTAWMHTELTIAVWKKPAGARLRDVEVAVLRELNPPLNLTDVERPWRHLRDARRSMAAEARRWPR